MSEMLTQGINPVETNVISSIILKISSYSTKKFFRQTRYDSIFRFGKDIL